MFYSKRNSYFTNFLLAIFLVAMLFMAAGCLDNTTATEEDGAYYRDADGDGFGDSNDSIEEADQPDGYVTDNTDCDDNEAAANPGAAEICDGIDNNCDGQTDEGCGTVWAWGSNTTGRLGDGTITDSSVPVQVVNLTDVIAIGGGYGHTIALKNDGTVWAWGWNFYGQLGDGTTTNSKIPVQVLNLTDVTAIAGGEGHSIALKNDGTVWAWGTNRSFGKLGDGTTTDSSVPVQVVGSGGTGFLTNVTAIASGYNYSIALKNDGTVWAWGSNSSGQLGDGTTTDSKIPVQVLNLTNVTAIAGGVGAHTIALKNDGTVWAWGGNRDGRLGDGTNTNSSVPVQVVNLINVTAIAGGSSHSIALKDDGTVWAWGSNSYYQLGDETTTDRNVPVQVVGSGGTGFLTNVTAIAGGDGYSIALKNDGTVWAWGGNWWGQLGNGTTADSDVPVQVVGTGGTGFLTNVTAIAGVYDHTVALR